MANDLEDPSASAQVVISDSSISKYNSAANSGVAVTVPTIGFGKVSSHGSKYFELGK